MFEDVLAFAALPLAAAIVFTGIHTWFGLQVLRRNVVFADLALAQVSAMGATVAVVAGHSAASGAGYAYTVLFAAGGALLLTGSRAVAASVRQEAFIGVLYVVATAATVLLVDRSPQGAEHVKKMLVGSLLAVTPEDLLRCVLLYATIGALHWCIRHPLLACADERPGLARTAVWDAVFYLSFGLVVTSSVSMAGVLLVFCFLIVPALIGSLFSARIGVALVIGWTAGAIASVVGIFGAFVIDAPTGAVTVLAFAAVLIIAGCVRTFVTAPHEQRRRNRLLGLRASGLVLCAILGLSGLCVLVAPAGDHPVLGPIEWVIGIGPERFLTQRERADYLEAAIIERRHKAEVDQLYDFERRSRWQGEELAADEVRRIASLQQTLTEMGRGERFVVDYLRTRARKRERWYVGLPLVLLGSIGLAFAFRVTRGTNSNRRDAMPDPTHEGDAHAVQRL
jgi:zinc/manganese transport system permease protein